MELRSRAPRWLPRSGWLAILVSTVAFALATSEYQLKAVFLFNFAQFVEWPASVFARPEDPVIIGVLGIDPFGADLDAVLDGEEVSGRPLIVHRYKSAAEIQHCHLLFIPRTQTDVRQILGELQGRPILTVGETAEFIDAGGMIRFVTEGSRIRLHINLRAADAAQLRLSSKLLRSSQIVARAGS